MHSLVGFDSQRDKIAAGQQTMIRSSYFSCLPHGEGGLKVDEAVQARTQRFEAFD